MMFSLKSFPSYNFFLRAAQSRQYLKNKSGSAIFTFELSSGLDMQKYGLLAINCDPFWIPDPFQSLLSVLQLLATPETLDFLCSNETSLFPLQGLCG